MNPQDKIGNKYAFDYFKKSFYITGFSLVTKKYEIAFQLDYGDTVEWCLSNIKFNKLEKYSFIENVNIESLNIIINEPRIKYLNI